MATVDLYQICERYRDVIAERDKRKSRSSKGTKIQGMFDLSGLKLKVIGDVDWTRLPVAQQQSQGSSFMRRLDNNSFNVSRIHEHYRKVQILSGRVIGIYNPLKMPGPDGGEISIDPGCPSCDHQDQVEIRVEGVCQKQRPVCSFFSDNTPVMTVSYDDVKQRYGFKCFVVCEGKVRLLLETGSDDQTILEVMRDVKADSLIKRTNNGNPVVCWEMTGEYTTNGQPLQSIEIE